MNSTQQGTDDSPYKEKMYTVIADLFEKTGANNPSYTETKKATDILEVLSTLLAFTIYNSCPNSETIRDTCEAAYFQIKQMSLAYHYQMQQENSRETKVENRPVQSVLSKNHFKPRNI